jgi:hypothetical protein
LFEKLDTDTDPFCFTSTYNRNTAGKPDPGIATTTNATNSANHTNNTFTTDDHSDISSPSRFTLPPLAQPYPALQRLPRLDAISSYEETFEEELAMATPDSTQEEESRSSDTEEIKRVGSPAHLFM